MVVRLSNDEENWIFNTASFSENDVVRIFNAIKADRENITSCDVLVKPHPGHVRAVRYICSSLFKRVRNPLAREILAKHKAAKQ